MPSYSNPFRISYWAVKADGFYSGYGLWTWLKFPLVSPGISFSLSMMCLAVGIHLASFITFLLLFWIYHYRDLSAKHPQYRPMLVIAIRGVFFTSLILSYVPIMLYSFMFLKAIDFDHKNLHNNTSSSGIHSGPSLYLWGICISLHIAAIYLVIKLTRSSISDEVDSGRIKVPSEYTSIDSKW